MKYLNNAKMIDVSFKIHRILILFFNVSRFRCTSLKLIELHIHTEYSKNNERLETATTSGESIGTFNSFYSTLRKITLSLYTANFIQI